jgi:hypothetical protein
MKKRIDRRTGLKSGGAKRLTVTLAAGQCEFLESLTTRNTATLAFVVRFAISKFIEEQRGGQLRLDFTKR